MKTVSLIFTSDEHGHLKGAPSIQRAVREARKENPTLLLSEGDMFEGSAVSALLGVDPARELVRAAGYDAIALGNHDFDRGLKVAREWVEQSPCPVLAANIREAGGEPLRGTRPSALFELEGVKIGLIGVTTPDTPNTCPAGSTKGIEFTDPAEAVRREAAALRAQGADLVGVMSHLGLAADRQLAGQVGGLEFILGGHSHDTHQQPEQVNGTLIAHPGCFRHGAGRLDLQTENGKLVGFEYRNLPVTAEVEPDDAVTRLVQSYEERMKPSLSEELTELPEDLDHDPDHLGDRCEKLLSQSMVAATGAQLALINQKFMRTGLQHGHLTRGQLMDALPFDNRVQSIKLKVGELLKMLTESQRRNDQTSIIFGGQGVNLATRVEDRSLMLVDSETLAEIPPDHELTVATTDYLLSGGLGYLATDLRDKAADFGLVRDAVEGFLKKTGKALHL